VLIGRVIQLTPLQFYYSLQTESQRAAAAAAAVAKETVKDRSTDCSTPPSCRTGDSRASRVRLTGQRRRSLAPRRLSSSRQLPRRRQAERRDRRPRAATKDAKNGSVGRDDERKRDSGSVEVERDETEERTVDAAAGEKHCSDLNGSSDCSTSAVQARQGEVSAEQRRDDEDGDSTSKSLSPASSSTPVAVSKLKIFKCSESKKLCVRSAEWPIDRSTPPDVAVPKLCVSKNLVVRRSGTPSVDVHDDDRRERRRVVADDVVATRTRPSWIGRRS